MRPTLLTPHPTPVDRTRNNPVTIVTSQLYPVESRRSTSSVHPVWSEHPATTLPSQLQGVDGNRASDLVSPPRMVRASCDHPPQPAAAPRGPSRPSRQGQPAIDRRRFASGSTQLDTMVTVMWKQCSTFDPYTAYRKESLDGESRPLRNFRLLNTKFGLRNESRYSIQYPLSDFCRMTTRLY